MRVVAAADRQTAIACRTDGNLSRGLVSDVAVHVGIHHVLAGGDKIREGLPELIPVRRGIQVEEGEGQVVVQRPAECDLARFSRNQVGDDRAVTGGQNVERNVGLAFDVDDFLPMQRIPPSGRRFVLALIVELLNKNVFDGRADVGEAPADTLVVADNHEWRARQGDAGDVEVAALQVRFEPQVGHLVIEVHIVGKQRLSGDGVLSGDNPVVGSWPEQVGVRCGESRGKLLGELRRKQRGEAGTLAHRFAFVLLIVFVLIGDRGFLLVHARPAGKGRAVPP